MEKQLLLKEAATRKKLLVLKRQLQADSGIHSSNKLVVKVQSEASNKSADDTATAPKTAQSEKLHITEHEGSVQLSMSMNGNFPTRLSIKSQPSHAPPTTTTTTTTTTSTTTFTNIKKVSSSVSYDKSGSVKEENKSKYKQSSFGPLLLDTTTLSNSTSATDHKLELVASVDKTRQAVSVSVDKKAVNTTTEPKSSTNTSSNDTIVTAAHNSKPRTRQRLAVPDTIKETEYMSAVTKQKARVSRIRRAIQAAIVIQRAWRKYKQNHVILN